jgi:hypothetical protein
MVSFSGADKMLGVQTVYEKGVIFIKINPIG